MAASSQTLSRSLSRPTRRIGPGCRREASSRVTRTRPSPPPRRSSSQRKAVSLLLSLSPLSSLNLTVCLPFVERAIPPKKAAAVSQATVHRVSWRLPALMHHRRHSTSSSTAPLEKHVGPRFVPRGSDRSSGHESRQIDHHEAGSRKSQETERKRQIDSFPLPPSSSLRAVSTMVVVLLPYFSFSLTLEK